MSDNEYWPGRVFYKGRDLEEWRRENMMLPIMEEVCRDCGEELTRESRVDVKEYECICYVCYKQKQKTVCVDFDGVLAEYKGWMGAEKLGEARAGVEYFLKSLNEMGFRVVVLSTREPGRIHKWLLDNGFHDLVYRVTREKVPAMVYIDDRALCFRGDFTETLVALRAFKPFWRL